MVLNINDIQSHAQISSNSCIAMSVECVLKLLGLMDPTSFEFQNNPSIIPGQNSWAINRELGDSNCSERKIKFSYEFDRPARGREFMTERFEELFQAIDAELKNNRYVIISLETGPNQWHMVIVYNKANDDEYETVTFFHGVEGPKLIPERLRERVAKMGGTDILIYKWV